MTHCLMGSVAYTQREEKIVEIGQLLVSMKNITTYGRGTNLKNNCRVLSVSVIPCNEALKCTCVGLGRGRSASNELTAFLIA